MMTSSVSNDKKPTTDSIEIKLLTLNCWGLKFVSAHRLERIHAIADFIASCSPFNSPSQSIDSIQAFSPDLTTSSHHHHHLPKPNPLPSSSLLSTKPLIKTTNHSHHHITTNHPHQTSSSSSTTTTTSHSSSHQTSFEPHSKSFDLIALQELWVYHDFLVIRDRAKQAGFRFSKFFHSAALGSGLAILSRFPIVSSHFYPYSLNGHPLHFIQGDFFVGKSVGSCLLDVPIVGPVEIFTTHLYAPHDVPAPEWKRAHRTAQSWELAKLVRASAERGRAVFVCGDLNSVPSSLPITLLQSYGRLRDAWTASHPNCLSSIATSEASYRNAIKEEGITCDSLINTFTASKNAANRGAKGFGKRLDYILYRPAAKRIIRSDRHDRCRTEWVDDQTITCDHCQVILTDPIPVFGYSYSDHFAVEASFTVFPSESIIRPESKDSDHPSNDQISRKTTSTTTIPAPQLTSEHLSNCMSALMTKYRSSQRSSQLQLGLFVLCLILVPGVSVGASFQPLRYLNWIFTLFSLFLGGFGITMLYSGFLAGNWERSAIQEICDQIELELESLHHQDHLPSYDRDDDRH